MELVRFAKFGSVEPYPRVGVPGIAGVLVCPQTKAGEPIRTAVSADVCEAARRLLEHRSDRKPSGFDPLALGVDNWPMA
jgi:hypothetical protein